MLHPGTNFIGRTFEQQPRELSEEEEQVQENLQRLHQLYQQGSIFEEEARNIRNNFSHLTIGEQMFLTTVLLPLLGISRRVQQYLANKIGTWISKRVVEKRESRTQSKP